MLSRTQKHFILKVFSLFSVVRGYNILIVVLAQYLASIYIFAPDLHFKEVLFDINLLILVLASSAVIASGYIINNFYDSEKDLINRPNKSMLDRLVSQNTKLSIYFTLNFLAVIFASYVSFRAVIFFALYIFAIWYYSHKLKKMPITGNLVSAILTVTPFFVIFIYYRNFELVVFMHALFLFMLVSMRELTKDLENIKGDFALNYRTIPVVYGEKISKYLLTGAVAVTIATSFILVFYFEIGRMYYFFYTSVILLIIYGLLLWKSNRKTHYLWLHNILKFIIVTGVFSIILIDINLVLNRL
ncbi:MAG: geranylgeranylglycerol-phosphate geranylgeranyltransferase [Winogradskyella sp.]|uniref:geranylgeranylglycerol-phosphate geranylgeranyltransferase n=1 Tax=Winogradskyella sp. TaxID=1883156 RepID=UPI00182E6303|nr:geranylgeranylglycerol-phosphate geranylgeranyltransferase [Winogradskyella sp.]MBT8244417.1 geranylgeranylglycerol-phosphate geranylgeranyltransferase [Winogradskyella sp.]NNK22519.1 geranylgeranylglycerol-phosphate geranylgeranyltransferase [Winogradskyella sp.]